MKSYLVEFIGTFFLVLVIGLTVIDPGASVFAPLAIGGILMVMVYAGGHISGGHYNPAVTLAVWMRGKCSTGDVLPYMLSQIAGAGLAALVVGFLKPDAMVVPGSPDPIRALLAEALFTFALCSVVLHVATSAKTAGNHYFGLAIGFTVFAGVCAVGGISGAALNPAVAVGVSIMGLASAGNLWIFLVGNFAGAAIAAVVYKVVNPE
jgi:aquaporin Z